jgi:hypothetical protein
MEVARPGRLGMLKVIMTKPQYIAFAVLMGIVYYALFYYIITNSSYGVFFTTAPRYLIYAMAVASAVLMSISIYSLMQSRPFRRRGLSGSTFSVASTFVGSLASSCGCSTPILSSILYTIGAGALGVSSIVVSITRYQIPILAGLIFLNIILSYYYLGKLSSECRLKSRRTARQKAK